MTTATKPAKRTALQRHNRAMNKTQAVYRDWQMSEVGTQQARRLHRKYTRYAEYLHALEDMALMFDYDDTTV